jgi:ATP-dependent exoDNAse (exonuclease V) beta subunit
MAFDQGHTSDRLVGTLVHRLIQRVGFGAEPEAAAAAARQLLRPDEAPDDRDAPIERAVNGYLALSQRDDVRAVYASGRVLHELPFTMAADGGWLRGTIDCIVQRAEGMTLLEFKTGRPRPEHRRQVELYRRAAERMFPGVSIDARVVYPNEAATIPSSGDAASLD